MKFIGKLCLLVLLCLVLCACAFDAQPQVAATTMPVYCFAQALCEGTPISVTRLITEEVSCVHDYTLTVQQMRAIEGAELVILSGAGLEEFMEEALHSAAFVVDCSEGIELLEGECHHLHGHEDAHGHEDGHAHEADPHIWLDPDNAIVMVENICSALTAQYPEYESIICDNATHLRRRIQAVKDYATEALSALSHREIITFHDGFGYLAHAFGLEIVEAIEEESGSEPSAQELIGLILLVEHHHVSALFAETNGSTAAAAVISAETGIPVYTLDMAMSGDSWFDAMYHNIDTLKEALG
ncbi:MAG: zinc ABC transporter substrate-binding protein [Oscillospiraceae bacterium]|nr:zinc ABC transporter substrate-binding protein [Oscillospiraceae bacterium]